ncbi:MAG: hypothetical protein LBB81_07945 [Treponema sp.]|jgi:hypothetical protein|nr:hypothetical protein [Treponema sp.]
MKILITNTLFFILTAVILLSTVTCVEPDDTDDGDTSVYLGKTFNVTGEQVWMPNYNTGKISEMFLKFTGDRDVDVIVIELTDTPPYRSLQKIGSSGEIKGGFLSFSVDAMSDNDLLNSDDLLHIYFNEWYEGGDNIVMKPEVKGNIITLVTLYDDDTSMPSEAIIKEGFYGTRTSLTGEYIYYLYVNADCTISAGKTVKTDLKYTFNEFKLSLKAGWNTICKSETYTTTGDSSYSIKVENPEIRWLIQGIK